MLEGTPPDDNPPPTNPMDVVCPNCGAYLARRWKFCIRCGLRHDPAAFERVAALDAERRAILAQLLPQAKPNASPPPVQSAPPIPAAESSPGGGTPFAPPSKPDAAAWLFKTMVYGGGLLIVVGALIYLRGVILGSPILQLALLGGATAGLLGAGAWGVRRRPDDLAARGGLWLGALLLPLALWLGVRYGYFPSVRWAYSLACGVLYRQLATRLNDRLLPHPAVASWLLAALWLGLDEATTAVAVSLVAGVAAVIAVRGAADPAHITATAGRWWAGAAVALCGLTSLALPETWVGGWVGAVCLVMGCLSVAPAAVGGWLVGGLGLLTVSYGRWLDALELAPAWRLVGWCGWVWLAAAGREAALRWETRRQTPWSTPPSSFAGLLEQCAAGALALWPAAAILPNAWLPMATNPTPLRDVAAYCTALLVLSSWSVWRLRKGLHWFPLVVLTLAVTVLSGTPLLLWTAPSLLLPASAAVICVARLGVEALGVRFGQNYSTEVDTSFGLDFGLPNHPAIVPARVTLDVCMLGYLYGLGEGMAQDWRPAHTLGFGFGVLYGGLCWLTNGVAWAQRVYALAMWGAAYLGALLTGCGAARADVFAVTPWIAPVAAAAAVGASRPTVDEWTPRRALRQASLGFLVFGALVALDGMLTGRAPSGGEAAALAATAIAGWGVAWRRREAWLALAATLCGGLAALQTARLGGCPWEASPMVGVAYGYGAAWLGRRRGAYERRLQGDGQARAALWAALDAGGQGWLWLSAFGGLAAVAGERSLTAGGGLICAAVALTVMSLSLTDRVAHDVYALGGLFWGGAAYLWWLDYLGAPAFLGIAAIALPYGLAVGSVGWLKRRFQRGHPALSEALIWLGSSIFCFPVAFEAIGRRLTGDALLFYDVLADTTALATALIGLGGRLRAPLTVGGAALGLHLSLVVLSSVLQSDLPYGVYLVGIGLLLFGSGIWLWRWCRR